MIALLPLTCVVQYLLFKIKLIIDSLFLIIIVILLDATSTLLVIRKAEIISPARAVAISRNLVDDYVL